MAAPKGKDKLDQLFNEVIKLIAEEGMSWRKALEGKMSSATFNKLIDEDNEKLKQYARATEQRAEVLADEMDDIANGTGEDDNIKVQRDRLKIETRKWSLAKMHPKKYGDSQKIEHSGSVTLKFDSDDSQL